MTLIKKPVNYLNNRDILKEIHISKTSYCSFVKPEYHQYDIIIDYLDNDDLSLSLEHAKTQDIITKAKENKAYRINFETGIKDGVKPEDISVEELVFRVMTHDHIPMSLKQPKKTSKKMSAVDIIDFEDFISDNVEDLDDVTSENFVYSKVNFPPFQHFKLNEKMEFECVGKSHWSGDMESGEFSVRMGQITNKLAKMYLMLCEKYATRFNWRGYTYNDEMRGAAILQLTYVGLRFNEAKSANPFAYYTAAINNSFCRVLNTEKRNQNIRDDVLEMNGLTPSWSRQFSEQNKS